MTVPTKEELDARQKREEEDLRKWEESGKLPCEHGRPFWGWCPHCMGFS